MTSMRSSLAKLRVPTRPCPACRCNFSNRSVLLDQTRAGSSNGNDNLEERHAASRAEIARKQAVYQAKYADRLKQKAKEAGVESVEQLRMKRILEASAAKANQLPAARQPLASTSSAAKGKAPASQSQDKSPVKPLSSILDLQKVVANNLSADQVGQLWTMYHSTNTSYLSAVIPIATYRKMLLTASQYAEFVVPLARGTDGESVEMWLLQWSRPTETASTVLFTPLAAFHARGTYAAPALILTHYGELAETHGIALMRGERTQEAENLLTPDEAKVLVWRLQRFYNTTGDEQSADGKRYRSLLEDFHRPRMPGDDFDIQSLSRIAYEV